MTIPAVIKPHAKPALPRQGRPAPARIPAPPGLAARISTWLALYAQRRASETEMGDIEAQIRPIAEDARQTHCQAVGAVVNTVVIEGDDGDNVKVKNQRRYKAIDPKVMPDLKGIFGETGDLIESKLKIRFTEDALIDEELLKKIVEAVGAENLTKYFDIREELSPTESFHVRRHTDSVFAKAANSAISRGLITPVRQSVRPE